VQGVKEACYLPLATRFPTVAYRFLFDETGILIVAYHFLFDETGIAPNTSFFRADTSHILSIASAILILARHQLPAATGWVEKGSHNLAAATGRRNRITAVTEHGTHYRIATIQDCLPGTEKKSEISRCFAGYK